jgi:asparagine synthase (glutamine-hydrolysing)
MQHSPPEEFVRTQEICIKHKNTFSFRSSESNGFICLSAATLTSKEHNTQLFIDGIIYNIQEEQLLSNLISQGPTFVNQLEGSFILFLINDDGLYIFTDKANSKKAYYLQHGNQWHISNNIHELPFQQCQLNLDGIACYLANGVMLENLTLYQDLYSTRGSSIYHFHAESLQISEYWKFKFQYTEDYSEETLSKELEEILINCIQEKLPAISSPLVSLSAGYDVRSILGIMHKYHGRLNINCVSYSLPENRNKNSDAYIAAKIAAHCQSNHTIYPSYQGNFIKHLSESVQYGKCLTHFCEEMDFWNTLENKAEPVDLIVGEQCFGYFDVPLKSKESTLGLLSIMGEKGISWSKEFLPDALYQELSFRLKKLNDKIWNDLDSYPDFHDKKDILYFEQRIKNVLLPWRENICGRIGYVHNPLLDGKLLNFIAKLPPTLRKNKQFFKNTIHRIVPELAQIEFATSLGYSVNWQIEIARHQKELIHLIETSESKLDELIPKEVLIKMIKQQSTFYEVSKKHIKRTSIYLRKKHPLLDSFMTFFIGPLESPKGHSNYPDMLVLRLLMMRMELIHNN